jgi:Gpi18-like mannosyltransferase
VLSTFLVAKLGFYLIAAFGLWMVPEFPRPWTPSAFFTTPEIVNVVYHWDGEWYIWIAEHGYELKPTGFSPVAFFPLLPLLINLVGRFLAPEQLPFAGVVVVNVAFLAAMFYLYALATMDGGRSYAQRAIWYVAIMPGAIFFHVIYSESLFLLAAVATIYHSRRGQFWLAGFWAMVASLARVQGVLLAVVIGWELLRRWRAEGGIPWRSVPALALPPLGIALYMGHLYQRFGEPLAFVEAQAAWNRTFSSPWATLWEAFWVVVGGRSWLGGAYGLETLNILVVIAFLVIALLCARRWPAAYNLYVFSGLLVALMTPVDGKYLMSGARFMAVLFPVAFALAYWSETRPILGRAVMVVSLPLFGLLAALFVAFRDVY